jgi:uncharacterized membrane protein YeaQ/YmgE (transglycosylase-associated protein family)
MGALVAMAAGAFSGALASFCLRLPMQGVLKRDSLLGLLGFIVGMAALVLIHPLGLFFINRFVDPYLVACIVAALLPLVRELSRFGRSWSHR